MTDLPLSLIGYFIPAAHAQISNIANYVSNDLSPGFGPDGGFVGIAVFLRGQILLIVAPVAITLIVRAGSRLINSQEDDKLTKAKNTIASVCVGIMLAYVSDRLVNAFFAPGGGWSDGSAIAGANILTTEIAGALDFFTSMAVILSILIIIVSGLRAVTTFGKDDGPAMIRQSVMGVVTGLLLMAVAGSIKAALGLSEDVIAAFPTGSTPSPIIVTGVNIVLALLGFTSLIAFAVIVYAGMRMVLNWGNEENYTKGKDLIFRAVIGLVIMLLSGTAVVFISEIVT